MAEDNKYIALKDKETELKGGASQSGNFKEDLKSLFEPDHIKDNQSISILNSMGGITKIVEKLQTNVQHGIKSDEQSLQERGKQYGFNHPVVSPPKSFWFFVAQQFEDLMLRVLTAAAIIAVIIGILKDGVAHGWMEGVAICSAVVIVVTVGSVNNYAKERQFAKLNAKKEQREVKITRDGNVQQIDIYKIMVGDLYHVTIGEILPVDGLVVSGSGLQLDESSVTGESDLIFKCSAFEKNPKQKKSTPFILSGTKVMDGTGMMIVCTVGTDTQIGQLKLRLQEESQATPLQLKLEDLANDIGKAGLWIAVLTVLAMCVHLVIDIIRGRVALISMETANQLVKFLIVGVTIIVVAIPEGLPLAVTISLAYSVGKMKDENNLVRHLSACEIMGGANNICSDKTGTLTQNKMTVTNLYFEGENREFEQISKEKYSKSNVQYLCENMCVNSDANPELQNNAFVQLGNKTECALLELAYKFGHYYPEFRAQMPEKSARVIPFNSSRKRMVTVWKSGTKYIIYVKGASEVILNKCKYIAGPSEMQSQLTKEKKEEIEKTIILSYAKKSLRTLSMAYKEVNINEYPNIDEVDDEELEKDLTLSAIAGIKDPLRPDVTKAIETCYKAGILVRMVTGDNLITAVAIAKDCKILAQNFEYDHNDETNYTVLEGKRFRELVGGVTYEHPEETDIRKKGQSQVVNLNVFKDIARQLRVLARSTPDDKYTLVTGLIQLGNVVAVTGDGTNDAPALKKADVGFAMGIAGTEVAKEAAGIILLDDNFSSIVTACKWGRNIFDCIRKFLQFQLTINIVACFLAFFGGVVVKESPLNSIQMLWVNLIMDSFASLALATEPPSEELLKRQPYSRKEYIVTPQMAKMIVGQSLFQITVLIIILFLGPSIFNVPSSIGIDRYDPALATHYTMMFNTFVMMQVFNQINCRKLKSEELNVFNGFFNNYLFLFIEVLIMVVQILIVEYGGPFFRVSGLTVSQHLICIIIGMMSLVTGFLIRLIPDSLFSRFKLFNESTMVQEDMKLMDKTYGSVLRRKASNRIGMGQENQERKLSQKLSQKKVSTK